MKGILILEITTSAPIELLENKENIKIGIKDSWMDWTPEINQVQFMETLDKSIEYEKKKAIGGVIAALHTKKALSTPFNMGMGLDMSLVGGD